MISSESDPLIENPFNKDHIYIRDLIKFEIIYLNHKIIKDDLSNYYNKFNKNYNLFITSLKKEYKSILDYKYGYKKENVILLGSPYFDNLEKIRNNDNDKKKIIIYPTWRQNIEGTRDLITHESIYYKEFIYTEYFNFYNNLINYQKLLLFMKQHNFIGTLCLHPFFKSQIVDFNKNEIFSIKSDCNYKNLLNEYSILITDYSSIFFYFGYLKKPIIYALFDYENYKKSLNQRSYFDYNSDGFGPICKDVKCTVNEIIITIENNCKIKKKYLRRIKKIFNHNIENSNEKIYKILNTNKNLSKINDEKFYHSFFIVSSFYILFQLKNYFNL